MMIIAILIVLVIIGAPMVWLLCKSTGGSKSHPVGHGDSQRLFRELAHGYQLSSTETAYLRQLAVDQGLTDPCALFVDPKYWIQVDLAARQDTTRLKTAPLSDPMIGLTLFNRLFITSSNESLSLGS